MQDEQQDVRLPDDPRQRSLDFVRGEQLAVLQKCELPKDAKDSAGKGVRANVLKSVLTAIDHHGRGTRGGCYASIATLAKSANIGTRTCTRSIEVLLGLGLICVTNDGSRAGVRGSPTNRYTIVWTELDLLVDGGPLYRAAARSMRVDQSATGTDQSATGTDQSATGTDQSATGTDQSATSGAQSVSKRQEAQLNAPSDVWRDEGGDGARYFFGDEVAAVRDKANRINRWFDARTYPDRELVLKVATLWHDGQLAEDTIGQVLESYERKQAAGNPIRNTRGWFWSTLRNKCLEATAKGRGERLEKLLAITEFPRELLAPPAERIST
jgi:hypothetical protein